MKHNFLKTLLVGLLTVVGVSQVWAEYKPVNGDANFTGFTFNKTLIGGINGYFTDDNECAHDNTRRLSPNSPVTIKFANAFEYTDASLKYDKKKFDLYVKITSNIKTYADASHRWQAYTDSRGFVTINTETLLANDFEFEAWLQDGERNATEVQFIAGNCYVHETERIKIYGDRNEVFTNNDKSEVPYITSGEEAGFWKGSSAADQPTRYLIGSGYTSDHHVKMAYKNTSHGSAEFVIGYLNFKITLNKPSGGDPVVITKRMNDTIKLSEIDTIKGWEVVNGPVWLVNDSCIPTGGGITKNYRDSVRATGDITLKGYSPYDITFAPNLTGATVSPTTKKVEFGDFYGAFPVPYCDGWLPTGWFTATSGGNKIVADSIVFKKATHTLYAQWIKGAIVTFKVNGGDALAKDTIYVPYNTPYGTLPTPSRPDYLFDGWFTDSLGGTLVEADTVMKNEHHHYLWAHWTRSYTVTFIPGEGATVSPSSKDYRGNQPYGEFPTPQRPGYTFSGWFREGGENPLTVDSIMPENAHELYAHWTANKYQVTFVNASGEVSKANMEVTYDAAYGELATATHNNPTDYTNRGWNTAEDGTGRAITTDSLVKIADNHNLYAQWESKPDTVTLHLNYDVQDTVFGTFIARWNSTYNDTRLDNYTDSPSRYGWQCVGWFDQKVGGTQVYSTTDVPHQNKITLYAHWEAKTMKVTFYPQGGSCSPTFKSVTYNQQYGDLPTPTMASYTFLGWRTGETSGDFIESSTIVTTEEDHNLYAQWEGKTVVTYNANGGTCATETNDVIYGGTYGELPTPTYSDYSFNGWYTEQTGGTQVTASTPVTNPENHTLYAHWLHYASTTSEAVRVYYEYFSAYVDLSGGGTAKWVDTDEEVNVSARTIEAGESATMKFANAFNGDYDILVKVTPDANLSTTWIGQTVDPYASSDYLKIYPNQSGETPWIDYEFWLEKDGETVDLTGFMAAACGLEDYEYVRFYGRENVIYSNHHTSCGTKYNPEPNRHLTLVYDSKTYQAWYASYLTGVGVFFGSLGTDERSHSKISYKRTQGSAEATFMITYQTNLGPWTLTEMKTDWRGTNSKTSMSMDDLNCKMADKVQSSYYDEREIYGERYITRNFDRRGFWFYDEDCAAGTQMAIYSLYKSTRSVPAHSKVVINWEWSYCFDYNGNGEGQMELGYYPSINNCGANYIFNTYEEARSTAVNATYNQGSAAVPANRINYAYMEYTDYNFECKGHTYTNLTYDNSEGEEAKDVDLWMLMTNVAASHTSSAYCNFQLYFANGNCGGGDGIKSATTYHSTILKFDANGGSGTMTPQVIDAVAGGTKAVAIKANTFTYTKHTFIGWNTEADGTGTAYAPGAQYTASDETMGEHILYAQWADNITVTFDGNGGTPSFADKEVYNGGTYGDLPTATNGNLYFDGWFTDATEGDKVTSTTVVTATSEHTLYAHWLPVYTCTFEVNGEGGSVDPTSKYVAYQRPYDELPAPTRPGYTFNKWWTLADGGTEVTAATLVPVEANHSIYAHWTAKQYTVTFNKNGGQTVSPTSKKVTYDAAYGTLATATHATHAFAGWWTAQNGGEQVTAETIVKTAGNHNLWAHWFIPEVTDGTGMTYSDAKQAVDDSLAAWNTRSASSGINVVIKRKIWKDGYFNTLCLPFDLTAAQITQTFGSYKELKKFVGATVEGEGDDRELIIELEDTTAIKAGKPYLISFNKGTNLTELLFRNVQITKVTMDAVKTSDVYFQGVLAPVILTYDNQNYLFLGADNRLFWPIDDGKFMPGFAAFFRIGDQVGPAPVKRGMKASFGIGKTVPTANDNVNVNDNNEIKKLIEEGRVVIKTNGVKYDMNGRKIVD